MNNSQVGNRIHFLKFTCKGMTYCLNMSFCKNIKRLDELEWQFNSDGSIGQIAFSGKFVPVFYLADLFGSNNHRDVIEGKIIVINHKNETWGLLVDELDSVIGSIMMNICPILPIIGDNAYKWFEGIVMSENDMIPILSLSYLSPIEQVIDRKAVASQIVSCDSKFQRSAINVENLNKKIIVFSDNSETTIKYGLSITQLSKIINPTKLNRVPGTYPYILGLFEWGGMCLPLIQLSLYLGDSNSSHVSNGRWLIIKVQTIGIYVGILVQPQVEIKTLPLVNQVSNGSLSLDENMIRGKFELQNLTLVMLDANQIFAPKLK